MNKEARSLNSIRNIILSVTSQVIMIFVVFFSRTLFIKILGATYLGVNGLFYNILTLLSLAELGVGNVMIYSLYKPIAKDDKEKITKLLNFYKKIYIFIALFIFSLGLLLVPFLKYLVNSNLPLKDITIYYVVFLLNSVFSYMCVYKTTLINADQRIYIVKWYTFLFQVMQNIIQIIILIWTKNYLLYLIIQAMTTLLTNIFLSYKTSKLYPFINEKKSLEKQEKTIIFNKIKATLLYKIGVVFMNNTDNILISIILGTIYVGYYSNYILITSTINTIIALIINAISSSVGNLNALEKNSKKYKIFTTLILIFQWGVTFCSIALFFLLNDFILLWLGKDFLLDKATVLVIVANFYLANVISPVWMYRETLGLFEKIKYVMLIASLLNVILSIALGFWFGLIGILGSTLIARLLTTVWYEPIILYRDIFKIRVLNYFKQQLFFVSLAMISFLAVGLLLMFIKEVSIIHFILKIFICLIVPNLIFFISLKNKDDFIYIKQVLLKHLNK